MQILAIQKQPLFKAKQPQNEAKHGVQQNPGSEQVK